MVRTVNQMRGSRWGSALCALALVVAAALSVGACQKEGSGQKAGEAIDNAKDKVSDALNPKGPAEKAGRSVDRATGN